MRKSKIHIFLMLAFAAMLSSCMNDDALRDFHRLVVRHDEKAVFVVNEGNFMYGNSSLSFYDPHSGEVQNNVFYNTNALPLGDVAYSMQIHDSLAYIVVNNSGKIYVINVNTFRYVGKITGFTSPRHMLFLSDTKAYVSDLYARAITMVNPEKRQIIGQINLNNYQEEFNQHSSEQMIRFGDFVFTNAWSYDNQILIIDSRTNRLADSISVAKQPNSMVLDKNNKLWVLSDGGFPGSRYGQELAALTRIDAQSRKVEEIFTFQDSLASPNSLVMNPGHDSLYFLYNSWAGGQLAGAGLYVMPITETKLPDEPLIEQNNRLFYALGVDPSSGNIYLSDAIDFVQRGEILVYTPKGIKIDHFRAGIIPTSFCFK
jgi:hypothetical protein